MVATFAAATFAFFCLQLAPGDPATALGEGVPASVRESRRAVYGYDAPVIVQYVRWISAAAQGDLGWSVSQQRPAVAVVLDALPNSLVLVLPGVLLAVLAGTALGAWQGIHARSMGDRLSNAAVFLLYALPEFWIALFLLLLFSVIWPVFPSGGMVSDLHVYMPPTDQWRDRLCHLVLPCLVIALFDTAALARYQRESMRDTLEQPFVRTARAAGLPWGRVYVQAWRASLLPVLTVLGILLPLNIMGVVFVEQVFAWPGMGLTLFNAINARDYDVVAACVIVGGAVIAFSGAAVDVLREVADPRLRMGERSRSVVPSSAPAA
ncbi:ABC transporter permease [Gemmatimonas phototrophica]|uniref:ABC transporter permease n=1 Tax=Gemmatimonas phototrophica TaxID=1379270 RepID=UPI000AF4BDD4|nr:ABC transporter permease [Gemmatimonas phototrophica]